MFDIFLAHSVRFSGSAPCGTSTNLECAKAVYNWGGKTWKFWSTCTTCGACSSA